jgi:hypothetical protein
MARWQAQQLTVARDLLHASAWLDAYPFANCCCCRLDERNPLTKETAVLEKLKA